MTGGLGKANESTIVMPVQIIIVKIQRHPPLASQLLSYSTLVSIPLYRAYKKVEGVQYITGLEQLVLA